MIRILDRATKQEFFNRSGCCRDDSRSAEKSVTSVHLLKICDKKLEAIGLDEDLNINCLDGFW